MLKAKAQKTQVIVQKSYFTQKSFEKLFDFAGQGMLPDDCQGFCTFEIFHSDRGTMCKLWAWVHVWKVSVERSIIVEHGGMAYLHRTQDDTHRSPF